MSLKSILAAKGEEVVSIDFTNDLAAAAKLLTKRRIGALVVLGVDGRLAGILSERDMYARWRKVEVPLCSCRSRRS